MTLQEQILQKKLPDPFAQKFEWSSWDKYMANAHTAEDKALYDAAKLVRTYIEALLTRLRQTEYDRVSAKTLVGTLFLEANLAAVSIVGEIEKAAKMGDRVVGRPVRVDVDTGDNYTTDDIHTAITDALTLPLSYKTSRMNNTDVLDFNAITQAAKSINPVREVAVAWNALKHVWQLCLYHGYAITIADSDYLAQGRSDQAYFVVGRQRQMNSTVSHFTTERAQQVAKGVRQKPRRRSVKRNLTNIESTKNSAKSIEADSFIVDAFFRERILCTSLNSKIPIEVSTILLAWEFLADVANSIMLRIIKAGQKASMDDALGRCSVQSLRTSLAKALNISQEDADAALAILTYSSTFEYSPWLTPMVDMADGTCLILLGVLTMANRTFTLEGILNRYGYDFGQRGPAFEAFLCEEIKAALEACRYGEICQIYGPSLVLTDADGQHEEIDALLSVGRDLYIIEAKCTQFPVELADELNIRRALDHANDQLDKKLAFLAKNLANLNCLNPELARATKVKSITGLIVTSFSGGPAPWSKHPITDVSSLTTYFGQGASISFSTTHSSTGATRYGPHFSYYSSFSSLRENLPKYLRYSPHNAVFGDLLERTKTKFKFAQFELKDIFIVMPQVVVPPDEALSQHMASHFENLRRQWNQL